MIYSMTAFARHEIQAEWGSAIWEIRSVNQRYLETFFRLPDAFRNLENTLRETLRQRLARGKVECNLRVELKQAQAVLNINQALVEQVIQSLQTIKNKLNEGNINPIDILRYPGVVDEPRIDVDHISQAILAGFNHLLEDFIAMRAREGEKLSEAILSRLQAVGDEVTFVRQKMPDILQWQRERLLQRFEEVQLQLDPTRLEQEMILLAQRIDVAEELDRLEMHIKETTNILQQGGVVGRRLDFMMQELNRESNTLASKSINTEVTNSAVTLKVLIEQMREQVQNIE